MTKRNKPRAVRKIWCWQRWIGSRQQEIWIERLQSAGCVTWTLTERPHRVRVLLAVYTEKRAAAASLHRQFGGRVRSVPASEWMKSGPTPPTRIGSELEIIHEKTGAQGRGRRLPRLHIPHGMAFGSGDHATTHLLLRALASLGDLSETAVLDLGTGSGVLALAARRFGARRIVATDFDPGAIRTARQNEALNFSTPLVRWRCGDVRRLRATARYDLVLANLFSGILDKAAPPIAGSVAPGGQLWLSGILRTQQASVVAAYRGQRLKFIRVVNRGKWIMLQWSKPVARKSRVQKSGGAGKKSTQTK